MAYYDAVSGRGEVGVSRFELEATVTPLSDAHWRRAGVEGHGERREQGEAGLRHRHTLTRPPWRGLKACRSAMRESGREKGRPLLAAP